MASSSLKLQTNVPETIALEFADGLPVESQFGGNQRMFSLCDGRKFYCSPFVAQQIAAAGIAAKQPFTICKREISLGNRRTVEYQIDRVEAAAAFSQNATAAAIGSTSSSNLTTQAYNGNAARQLHVMNAPAAPPPAPAPAPVASDSSAVALMKIAGCGAIDAVLEIESYAKSKGLPDFAFCSDDIQKLTVTLFLSMKGGRA